MKLKGKICLLMAILTVVMVGVLIIPAVADGEGAVIVGDTSRFKIEKNVFVEGEPIFVTAIGGGRDWVGIISSEEGSSARWYYLGDDASKGFGSGMKVDLHKAPRGNNGAHSNLPEGDYTIYFFPNDGSMPDVQPIAYAEIQVVKAPPARPKVVNNAKYTLKNKTDGYAEGKVTVFTDPDQIGNVDIVMYWGNDQGKLPGYASLAKFKVTGTITVENISKGVIIPYGATKLMIYARSKTGLEITEDCFTIDLPEGAASKNYQNPLFSYTVVSDVHITLYPDHIHNKHFKNMLEDVTKLRPNSIGNIIVGDVADQGNPNELKNMDKIYKSVNGVAPLYMSVGDHDMRGGMSIPNKAKIFNSYIKLPDGKHPEKLHYDFWQNGYHFIFLGTDEVHDWSISTLHKDTLKWLDETLAENYDPNRPAFIFLHQPLPNTVVGSLKDKYNQYWGQINPTCEAAYRKVLAKYPEAILFNGHTHGLFDSECNIYMDSPILPTVVNTAAVAYEWDTYDDKYEGKDVRGSEGYIVDVYPEKIVLKGRNFETGEWVPNAQYILRYAEDLPPVEPEGTETKVPEINDSKTPGDNEFDAIISSTEDELKNAVLSEEELKKLESGSKIKVSIEVSNKNKNVSEEDKKLVESVLGDYKVEDYLDINLYKKIDSNSADKVLSTNQKLKITLVLSKEMLSKSSDYIVVRVHDGIAEAINGSLNSETNEFTFETDKFSTYALAYKVSETETESETQSGDNQGNSKLATALLITAGVILAAGAIVAGVVISKKHKK